MNIVDQHTIPMEKDTSLRVTVHDNGSVIISVAKEVSGVRTVQPITGLRLSADVVKKLVAVLPVTTTS